MIIHQLKSNDLGILKELFRDYFWQSVLKNLGYFDKKLFETKNIDNKTLDKTIKKERIKTAENILSIISCNFLGYFYEI